MPCPVVLVPFLLFPTADEDPSDLVRQARLGAQRRLEEKLDLWPERRTWAAPWAVRRGRYEVRSIHSYWLTNLVAESLSAMDPFIQDLLGVTLPEDRVFVTQVLASIQEYNKKGEELQDDRAAYHSSSYGSVLATELPGQPVLTYDPDHPETLVRFATHGAVHEWLAATGEEPLPAWVEEGLCSYLTMYWDQQYGDRHFGPLLRMRREGRALAPSALMQLPLQQWQQQHYIQSAVLFHYLLNVCEDTATYRDEDGEIVDAPFLTWLQALLAGRDASALAFPELLREQGRRWDEEFAAWDPLS